MDVLRNTQDNLLAGQAKLEEYENNLKSEMVRVCHVMITRILKQ